MMKKYIIQIITIAFLVFTYSCKDFLEVEPEGKIFESTYYDSQESAEETVIATYDMFGQAWPISPIVVFDLMASERSDESVPNPGKWPESDTRSLVANFNINASMEYASGYWEWCYAGVGRTNVAIDVIERIPQDEYESEEKKNSLIAEARLFRAYFYLHLVKNYGGVPLVNARISPEKFQIPRSTQEEVFTQIKNDLKFAMQWLPLKAGTISGRATKGLATYLMAQSLVFEAGTEAGHKNWQEAYDYADKFVNGEYANEYRLLDNYANIWKQGHDFNDEIIFEWVYIENMEQANSWYIVSRSPLYVTSESGNRVDSWGWGHVGPTQNMVDAFETNEDWGDALEWEDPRLQVSVWRPGDIVPIGADDADNVNDSLEIWLDEADVPVGYETKKYMLTSEPEGWYPDLNPKIYRFADLILLHAEAAWYIGKYDEAKNSLNRIRKRARQGNPGNVLPDITAAGQELLEAIWHERNVELCFEHHRFYDLVRTGRTKEVLHAIGKTNFIEGVHELLPIPQSEMDLIPVLEQNPGY
jgi:starch-binding outer membrane protein, SusD/RagB family